MHTSWKGTCPAPLWPNQCGARPRHRCPPILLNRNFPLTPAQRGLLLPPVQGPPPAAGSDQRHAGRRQVCGILQRLPRPPRERALPPAWWPLWEGGPAGGVAPLGGWPRWEGGHAGRGTARRGPRPRLPTVWGTERDAGWSQAAPAVTPQGPRPALRALAGPGALLPCGCGVCPGGACARLCGRGGRRGHRHPPAPARGCAATGLRCAACPGAVLRLRWGLPEAVCSTVCCPTGCAALLLPHPPLARRHLGLPDRPGGDRQGGARAGRRCARPAGRRMR